MPTSTESALIEKRPSDDADGSGTMKTPANTRLDDNQGNQGEMSMDISERLNKLHLPVDDRMRALICIESENEPRTSPITHGGSWAESTISHSQITTGRDMSMTSYNVTGNLTINKYEGAATENDKKALERRNYVDDEDEIAPGMLVPAPSSCILERDTQHDQIVAKLVSTNNARVTILGMGGIGKTTLACSVANDSQIVDAYLRRLFLSFEGCSTADLAYTNLANAFQTPVDRRSSHRQILSHVLNYLKQQKTLLIIDNFETFWEVPSNRRAAEDFLSHLAALRELAMIVTLRGIQRPGNIRWVKIDPLQTLTHEASKELLSIITDEEYSDVDSEYIQRLLNAVSGIPLAVTLIGSLLRDESETPQSLWNQWTRESARAIRVANEVDSDDRLYKLDISLRLSIFSPRMSDNAKEVLAAISILPIGLNTDEEWLDNFQSLLPSTIRVRDCIRTLRDVALVTLDLSTAPHRLRLLPPVRDFCLNNLPLRGELHLRLIDIYNADLLVHWAPGSSKAYTWVTMELSNIAALLNHAIKIRYLTESLGEAIFYYTEWLRFLCMPDTATIEQAITVLSELPKAKSKCLQGLGSVLLSFYREQEAVQHFEQALSIHRDLRHRFNVGWDLYLLGTAHLQLGDYATAERYVIEARDLFTETNENWGKGPVLEMLAEIYLEQGIFSEAESIAKEALELCRAYSNRKGETNALTLLGQVYRKQGRFDLAIENLTASRDVSQTAHDSHGEGRANATLGYLYRDINNLEQATLHFQLALSLYERAQANDVENIRAALEGLNASLTRNGSE